ncbi:hypothetical protein EVAR_21363_1 [Eumeta japonica]|uniref:Uncharacterized protein n=1 Tax=Eumeta variegata TaxID=151549 RepID=A0A4C1YG30_EUMVA|nr:hypothetical protein EVAR_21363_1 [Eumeta japonica]
MLNPPRVPRAGRRRPPSAPRLAPDYDFMFSPRQGEILEKGGLRDVGLLDSIGSTTRCPFNHEPNDGVTDKSTQITDHLACLRHADGRGSASHAGTKTSRLVRSSPSVAPATTPRGGSRMRVRRPPAAAPARAPAPAARSREPAFALLFSL